MKKLFVRIAALTMSLMMVLGGVFTFFDVTAFASDTAGETTVITGASGVMHYFKEDTYYDMTKPIDTPLTYEFELMAMGDIGGTGVRGGVILGNYGKDKTRYVNVELHTYGHIRFYVNNRSGKVADIVFTNTDVRKNNSVRHIAITIDVSTQTASLYVDGKFAESKTHENLTNLPTAADFEYNFRIGGDHRSGNTAHFEGAIDSVALYSDIRTAEEIAADASRSKTWSKNTDGLIAAYDITKQGSAAFYDYSGNNNRLSYTNGSGMLIENFGRYNIEKKLQASPETVEAWVFLPNYYTARGGTFFGNNGASKNTADIAFEIEYNGHPRFFYTTSSGTSATHEFGQVDVRTGVWQHVTIVHDAANSEARCYINGILAETLAYTQEYEDKNGGKQSPVAPYSSGICDETYVLGGDRQSGYNQYFKGFIKEVRVYSDIRTAEEIASDYAGTLDKTDGNLLACYQMSYEDTFTDIEDLSGNGYTAKYSQLLWSDVEPIGDYAYSLAVVGDTQTVTNYNPGKLKDLYQWIINNKTKKNIQYVIGLGDITEYGVDPGHKNYDQERGDKEWTAAKEAITMMDGILPYSLIRGAGHDGVEFFNTYFASHTGYTNNISGYYQAGRIENVYHTFKIGNVDYMILCLDFGAKDDVLAWANEVVTAHPHHRVIVTTHGYLEKDGSLLETGEAYCPSQSYYDPANNDGDDIWNKFVRKHANICMVMSGHMSANDVVVSKQTGDNGNEVTQILIDPQSMDSKNSPKGMVAMLYFSEDGEDVQVEYYSTLTDSYRPSSGFTVSYSDGDHYYDIPRSDATHHWNECSCGATDNSTKADHEFDNACDTDCACGYTRTITHNFTVNDYNNEQHWKKCSVCGTPDNSTKADHEFDNACDTDCACGYTRNVTHNYNIPDKDEIHHWNKCSCGAIDEKVEHSYTNACDTTCDCGYTRTVNHSFTLYDYNDAKHWKKCSVCGTPDNSTKADHEFDNACDTDCACGYERTITHNFTVNDYNNEQHWKKCSVCGTSDNSTKADHEFDNASDTNCDCGYDRGHQHAYDTLNFDGENHWNECSCEAIDEDSVVPHTYDNACDTDCACGYERTITHDYSVTDKNDTQHWKKCSVCGTPDNSTKADHEFDNACDTTCACGYERTVTHNYNIPDKDDNHHWNKCSCGATDTKVEHSYTNACDATCDVCNEARTPADHTGGTATCTAKAVCGVCGAEYGDYAQHAYGSAMIYNATHHWYECSCGSKKDETAHTFGEWTEKDGERTRSCVCGYTVTDPSYENGESSSAGATVCIVIGAVVAVGAATACVYFFVFKKKK